MDEIDKEIEQVAENMEKSQKDPIDSLRETIKTLGKDGLKKALPTLSDEEKTLLKSVMEDMNKAVEMDDAYQAKFVQGNINDTTIQEDKADDDQDEKLVKPEAAKHNHQGDQTPEGRDGHVIKAEELIDQIKKSDEMMYKMVSKMCKKCDGDRKMVMDKCMAKGLDKDKVSSMIDRAMKEHKDTMHKADSLEQTRNAGETDMDGVANQKMINKEEDQLSDTDKATEGTVRGDKARPEGLKVDEENKAAQDKVNDMSQGKMKKAIFAGENDLLKANTGGRNFHFSVNDYYSEVVAKSEKPTEDVKKSEEPKSFDLNDLIEKDLTKSWGEISVESDLKKNQESQTGKLSKSFADNEIAAALGLSEEEAKKILGE